jgi:3-hydroxy-9,10-secoandrosta-1,3,5(10)-triene-9,17-dione monooxygenase
MTLLGTPVFATGKDAVECAQQLAAGFRSRVPHAESLRRLPDETVAELIASGLCLLLVPRRFGGSELNYDAVLDVTSTIAAACPSTGWVYALWTAHMWLIAEFPEAIQAEVFGGANPLVSSVVNTIGTPSVVDGGYRWTGRGLFSSGVDHCQWLTPAMDLPRAGGPPERCWFLLPRADIVIVDDWYTMALKGTGSKTIEVNDVFIPDENILWVKDLTAGRAPGAALQPGVLYQAAVDFTFSLPVAMPVVGVARGFLAAVQERLQARVNGANPVLAREAMYALPRLAQATAEVDAAYAVLHHNVHRYCFSPASDFDALDRARGRRDTAYCAQLCRHAVNSLFESSGGSALYESSDMQRLWRDTNAAAAHHGLTWDIRAAEFGRALVGLPATDTDKPPGEPSQL